MPNLIAYFRGCPEELFKGKNLYCETIREIGQNEVKLHEYLYEAASAFKNGEKYFFSQVQELDSELLEAHLFELDKLDDLERFAIERLDFDKVEQAWMQKQFESVRWC